MKRLLFVLLALCGVIVEAQTVNWSVQWDQAAPDLGFANATTYLAYLDSDPPVMLQAVCVASGGAFTCTAPLPSLSSKADHTLALAAKNAAGESAKSAAVAFSIALLPKAPSAIRLIPPVP